MLPEFITRVPEENSSIHISHERCQFFESQSHFHDDLELNLILKSTGTRFVGDCIDSFQEHDLVLLGPNIPHYWLNDKKYHNNQSDEHAEAIVVRFPELFLGKDQYNLPEMGQMKQLFEKAKRGLLLNGDGKDRIISSIHKMLHYQGIERLIIFLGILNAITNACDLKILSSEGFMTSLNSKNKKRMNDVYDFITTNFKDKISLEEIANKAHMNPSAFSRFFSQCTGKSVTTFLQEIRLGFACKLLVHDQMSISDIISESGFQNQAYFNKLFIERKGMSPNRFKQQHKE